MKYIFLLTISLLVIISAIAQNNGAIKGTVTTSDDIAASGVSIQLQNRHKGTLSSNKGTFEFLKLAPGDYQIQVSLIGYKTSQQHVTVISGNITTANITLDASSAQLHEIVVSYRQQRYQVNAVSRTLRLTTPLLETPQNIQVVTSKLLADQQIFDMLEGVARNVSGVTNARTLGQH